MKVNKAKKLWEVVAVGYKMNVKSSKFRIRRELLHLKSPDYGDVMTYTFYINRLVQDWNLWVNFAD
jgi:hypothetical protein